MQLEVQKKYRVHCLGSVRAPTAVYCIPTGTYRILSVLFSTLYFINILLFFFFFYYEFPGPLGSLGSLHVT